MVGSTLLALGIEVLVQLVQLVLAFYAFWLVLRAMHGWFSEGMQALQELDPLACEFTDPFVEPLSRLIRASRRFTCWVWLGLFAILHVGLDQLPTLV